MPLFWQMHSVTSTAISAQGDPDATTLRLCLPKSTPTRWMGAPRAQLRLIKRLGTQGGVANRVGCRRRWAAYCSVDLGFCQIKEAPKGRGTFAQAFTPVASALTPLGVQRLSLPT